MQRIAARLYGPGQPPAGADATLVLAAGGDCRVEAGDGPALRLPTSGVTLRRAGFDLRGVELSWHALEGDWAVHVHDATAAQALLAALPAGLAPAAQALDRGRRRRWLALGALLLIVVLVPLALVAGLVAGADRAAGWVSARIPVEQERRLGEAVFRGLRADLRLVDDERSRAVAALGTRLAQGGRFRYQFHVADDPAVNAFALPGGIVVVHTGLLDAATRPEQVAGVLAHEIEHVEQRHGVEAMIKSLGLRAAWALVTGDAGGSLTGELGTRLVELGFSREAEREADERGFDRLVAAGIDPAGLVEFFDLLAREDAAAPPAFLSTHPHSAERREALRARLAALGERRFAPLPAFQ